jgi:biotin carboxyl carrier protein
LSEDAGSSDAQGSGLDMEVTKLAAPVTGVVSRLDASVGDTLAAQATVLVLESMKLEFPIAAPRAGRLARLLVGAGDAVSEGDTLAELE